MSGLPLITPAPPTANRHLPWDSDVSDTVQHLAAARRECGDTFVIDSGDSRYLFLFSPEGVRSFYELPEEQASKGIADWQMLSRKLPGELFDGRRTLPHQLFGKDDVADYLANLDLAIEAEWESLGDSGTIDVFTLTRRLGHRMGLASWAGGQSAQGDRFEALMVALDALDGAEAFVRPGLMAEIAANDHRDERAAMAAAEAAINATLADRKTGKGDDASTDLLADIEARWANESEAVRSVGIARDVILVHLASMTNLFAAMGWMIVDLLTNTDVRRRFDGGEDGLAERCAMESIRMAQRSIMLRAVLAEITVNDGEQTYQVEPGAIIATFLPLTNTDSGPGMDSYDPDRWNRRRLKAEDQLATRELVTTFGHGRHTCPATSFSLAAMSRSAQRLFADFELDPLFCEASPLLGQIGGVARAQNPCPLSYQRVR